jgi:gamma-glutamyltranspeptidase/glutathione hydrolase
MVPGYGFLLNNQLTDFNRTPRFRGEPPNADPGANDPAPGKRPRSTMTPTLLFVDTPAGQRPLAAFGSPGGSTIVNTVLQISLNLIDHGMSVQEAIVAPRISLIGPGEQATQVEAGFAEATIAELTLRDYRIAPEPAVLGSVQAVVIDPGDGRLFGGADPRRGGTVIGLPRDRCEEGGIE